MGKFQCKKYRAAYDKARREKHREQRILYDKLYWAFNRDALLEKKRIKYAKRKNTNDSV